MSFKRLYAWPSASLCPAHFSQSSQRNRRAKRLRATGRSARNALQHIQRWQGPTTGAAAYPNFMALQGAHQDAPARGC